MLFIGYTFCQSQEIEHPLALFHEYLRKGYYPFSKDEGYRMRLNQVVSMTLETDIPQYANYTVMVSRKLLTLTMRHPF